MFTFISVFQVKTMKGCNESIVIFSPIRKVRKYSTQLIIRSNGQGYHSLALKIGFKGNIEKTNTKEKEKSNTK